MRHSQSQPVLPALWALPPTAEGNKAPELGRISAPAPRLPRTHSAGWRVARGGFEERLERIQAQFEPRFPLSKEIRRKHIADVSCGDQLKAKLRLRSGHDLALRRGDAASEVGHSACKPGGDGQSVLLQRELELVETLELAGMHGETSDAGADAAQRLGKVTARALDACVALAPAWLAPVLSQTAGALKALLYSPDHTDDYGAPMLYKTVYLKVAADRMAVDASQLELLTFLLQKSEEKVRRCTARIRPPVCRDITGALRCHGRPPLPPAVPAVPPPARSPSPAPLPCLAYPAAPHPQLPPRPACPPRPVPLRRCVSATMLWPRPRPKWRRPSAASSGCIGG